MDVEVGEEGVLGKEVVEGVGDDVEVGRDVVGEVD